MDTTIIENLKKLREKHMLTQEALAEALGVPVLAVYMWEAGRLPIEYKMLQRIADFYDVTVESLTETEAKAKKAVSSDKVSFKCKICGGDLIYDCSEVSCRCANCGNKWAIAELYPKYSRVIATINKAGWILNSKSSPSAADEARLLFTQAISECGKYNDIVSTELVKFCQEGISNAQQLETYCRGKYFFDNKSYKSALNELQKVPGFRDADDMIRRCKRQN